MPDPSYYQLLGVDPQCSEEEIEAAYRGLLAENFTEDGSYKPGAKQMVQVLNQAYVVLTDPVRRKQYDYQVFWGKKSAGAGDSLNTPSTPVDAGIPDWLKATVEAEKTPPAAGDDEVVEWLEMLAKNQAKDGKQAAGEQHTTRMFIFISLFVLLTITILVAMLALAR